MKEKIIKFVLYIIAFILLYFGAKLFGLIMELFSISTEQKQILASVFLGFPILILSWYTLKLSYSIFCDCFDILQKKNRYIAKIQSFDAFFVFLCILLLTVGAIGILFKTN